MLGFLLASGGESIVEETISEVTPVITATPSAVISTYDGVIKTGFQWGTVVYYAIGLLFVLLLVYIVSNLIKGAKAKGKK